MLLERMNFILETNKRSEVEILMKGEPAYMEEVIGDYTITCKKNVDSKEWTVCIESLDILKSLKLLNNYLEKFGKHINLMGERKLGVSFNENDDITLENEYIDCSNGTYKTFSYAKMIAYGMVGALTDKDWLDKNFIEEYEEDLQ